MATTANFGWTKPTVGGDTGAWGGILNTMADDIDTDLDLVKTTADAALPSANGTQTGTSTVTHVESPDNDLGAVGPGVVSPNRDNGDVIVIDIANDAVTLGIGSALTAGVAEAWILIITAGASGTLAFNAAYKFPGGIATTQTQSGTDVYACITQDGSKIHIVRVSADSK